MRISNILKSRECSTTHCICDIVEFVLTIVFIYWLFFSFCAQSNIPKAPASEDVHITDSITNLFNTKCIESLYGRRLLRFIRTHVFFKNWLVDVTHYGKMLILYSVMKTNKRLIRFNSKIETNEFESMTASCVHARTLEHWILRGHHRICITVSAYLKWPCRPAPIPHVLWLPGLIHIFNKHRCSDYISVVNPKKGDFFCN